MKQHSFFLLSKKFFLSLSLLFQPQRAPPPPPPRIAHSSPKCPTPPQRKHEGAGRGALGSLHSRCPAAGGRFLRRCCRSCPPSGATFSSSSSSSARAFVKHVAQSARARSAGGHAPGTQGQRPSHPREPQRRQGGKTRTRESQSRAKCPGRWQRWQITEIVVVKEGRERERESAIGGRGERREVEVDENLFFFSSKKKVTSHRSGTRSERARAARTGGTAWEPGPADTPARCAPRRRT